MTRSFEPFSSAAPSFHPHRVSTRANIIRHRRRDSALEKYTINTYRKLFFFWRGPTRNFGNEQWGYLPHFFLTHLYSGRGYTLARASFGPNDANTVIGHSMSKAIKKMSRHFTGCCLLLSLITLIKLWVSCTTRIAGSWYRGTLGDLKRWRDNRSR